MVTDLASIGAKKYLGGLENLHVAFDGLSGDLFNGFVLEGVSVGDKENTDTITLKRAMVALDAKESWTLKKAVLRAEVEGLRIKEDRLNAITEAAQKDFPPSQEEKPKSSEPFPVFKYVMPQKFTAADLAGDMGWSVENLAVEVNDPDNLIWNVALSAAYQNEPIKLSGTASLSQIAMPEGADLNLKVMDCDVNVSAALKDGLVSIKNIEGILFSSPIKGTASIDTSVSDPAIEADISLSKINFDRLREWVKDLGPSTLEGFDAKITGTVSKPVGNITLKNGNFTYQTYKVSNLSGNVDLKEKKADARLSANAFGAGITVSGNAELDPKGAVSIKADVNSLDLGKVSDAVPQLKSAALNGTVSVSASVTGTIDDPSVTAKITSPKVGAMNAYSATDIAAALSATMKKATVESLALTAFGGRITASGEAELDPKGALSFKANVDSLDLSRVSASVPEAASADLHGVISATAAATGTLEDPKVSISVSSPKVSAMGGYEVSDIKAALKATMKQADIDSISMKAFGASITASGTAGLTPDGPLSLRANVNSLDLSRISATVPAMASAELKGVITASAEASGTLSDPKVSITVNSPKINAMKTYEIADIKAAITASAKQANIETLSLKAFNGKIEANGAVGFVDNAAMSLKGKIENLDLGAAVPGGTVKGIANSDFTISGTAKNPIVNLNAKIDTLDAAQFGAKDVALKVNGNTNLNVSFTGKTKAGTPFGGGGTLRLPLAGAKSMLNLKFQLEKMDISELLPNTVKYRGDIAADVIVKGSFEKPQVSAQLRSTELEASGYTVFDTKANAKLNGQAVSFDASVKMGDKRPTVTGTVDFSKGLNCSVNVDAQQIQVSSLHPSLEGLTEGRISLTAKGTVNDKGIDFSGRASSPVVNILLSTGTENTEEQGTNSSDKKDASAKTEASKTEEKTVKAAKLPIENILATFKFKDGKISMPTGQVGVGGSVINLKLDGDVDTATYNFSINGKSIDLAKLTEPLGLPAKITGKTNVGFEGKARTGITTLIQGGGKISMKDIVVDEFPGQSTVTGSKPFKIQSGNVFINMNDGELYIMPGSAISAPSDDTIYHFISFTGTAWKQARTTPKLDPALLPKDLVKRTGDMYHMIIDGSINVRVLNGVLGGLGAVMEAGESGDLSMENIGTNMLKKMITGGIVIEFRQFNLDISGKTYGDTPRINNLKFEGSGSYADVSSTSWTEDSSVSNEQTYSFSYPIAIGRDPNKIKDNPKTSEKETQKKKKKKK